MACWTPTAILRVECGVLDLRKSGQRSSCKMSQDKSDRVVSRYVCKKVRKNVSERMVKNMSGVSEENVWVRLSEPCSKICQLKWG